MIGILDYRAGNAASVLLALRKLGLQGRLVSTPEEIAESDRLILPGVGAARATMESLRQQGCLDALRHKVMVERIPFLGICVGMQILLEHSDEEDTPCLGWLPGQVQRYASEDLPVPQIGWNEVHFRPHPLLSGLPPSGHFYFVNSYYARPDDQSLVVGTANYGGDFCAVLARDNIFATQFHTEKSGPLGLSLLSSFATLDKEILCSHVA